MILDRPFESMISPEHEQDPQAEPRTYPISSPDLANLMSAAFQRGKTLTFRAFGTSMSPLIRDGDLVTASPLKVESPTLGDVVAFVHPEDGRLLVHRVVGRKPGGYELQGDNTGGRPDGLIPPAQILGRIIQVERNEKNIRLGLGPERYLVALLSRFGLLRPTLSFIKRFF